MAVEARSHTKSEVNRAGQLWAEFMAAYRIHRDDVFNATALVAEDVVAADEVLRWWRAEHATPLRIVNANLG